jgi:hypothetical protein
MIGENNTYRGQLRGYLFEVVIRLFLQKNGWILLKTEERDRLKVSNDYNIEIRGRGTWHQIDTPVVFGAAIPFIYPLRLLVEVKYYSGEIQKDKIRAYIGVIKDISENYFIQNVVDVSSQIRYTDIGAFFSANGFQEESIHLAYAHGIKTISYQNNAAVSRIKDLIAELEEGLSCASTISKNRQSIFMKDVEDVLYEYTDYIRYFTDKYKLSPSSVEILKLLSEEIESKKSSFFGMNPQGIMLHFVGDNRFPEELFEQTDQQECRIFFNNVNRNRGGINAWIEFTSEIKKGKYYFDAPPSLIDIILKGQSALNEKERIFEKLTVFYYIKGLFRTLTISIDRQWLQRLRDAKNG